MEVHFDMEPRVVKAHAKVEADRGRVAVERGPLVYCAEWPDNDFDIMSVLVNRRPQFETVEKPDMLCGLTEIKTGAQVFGCRTDAYSLLCLGASWFRQHDGMAAAGGERDKPVHAGYAGLGEPCGRFAQDYGLVCH